MGLDRPMKGDGFNPDPERWVRTCQECGHTQTDTKPTGEMTDAYRNRACHKCKSPGLDYGSYETTDDQWWWEDD